MVRSVEEMRAEQFSVFDEMGEDHVRLMLQNERWTGSRKAWSIEWLAKADQRVRLSNESIQDEAIRTARSAKNAAWAAAIAAIIAAIAAIAMGVIAFSGAPA